MKATTGYKVIMRFLYLLEQRDNRYVCLSREAIAEMLKAYDSEDDYGYSELSIPERIGPELLLLVQMSLLEEIRGENSLAFRLTELGRGFASKLEMPEKIEVALGA
jgi:hypothetical protein